MSDKTDKFEKVPQVEIDGDLFHESALVSFGITKEIEEKDVGGNKSNKLTFKLVKYIMVRGKVAKETVVRSEEGLEGKEILRIQLSLEMHKELKRLMGTK